MFPNLIVPKHFPSCCPILWDLQHPLVLLLAGKTRLMTVAVPTFALSKTTPFLHLCRRFCTRQAGWNGRSRRLKLVIAHFWVTPSCCSMLSSGSQKTLFRVAAKKMAHSYFEHRKPRFKTPLQPVTTFWSVSKEMEKNEEAATSRIMFGLILIIGTFQLQTLSPRLLHAKCVCGIYHLVSV